MLRIVYTHLKKYCYLLCAVGFLAFLIPGSAAGSPLKIVAAQETIYHLSDLNMIAAEGGWGPINLDKSVGEEAANDGNTLTINGTTYAKGIGTHATSVISFDFDGNCSTFSSWVGVDDEVGQFNGSVVFEVYADGQKIYDSGVMTGATNALFTGDLNISGTDEFMLVVTDAGDNFYSDHANWANPTVSCSASPNGNGNSFKHIRGSWGPVMPWPVKAIHASLLPSGHILSHASGDENGIGNDNPNFPHNLTKVDLANINTWSHEWVNNTSQEMYCSAHVLLEDGSVFEFGGHAGVINGQSYMGKDQAAIFDFQSKTWQQQTDMHQARWYPSAVTLGNGDVMAIGGTNGPQNIYKPEIFDGASWRILNNVDYSNRLQGNDIIFDHTYPFAHLVSDGRVFWAGWDQNMAFINTNGNGSWSQNYFRENLQRAWGAPVMYRQDKLLLIGGVSTLPWGVATRTTMAIDLSTGTPISNLSGTMTFPRADADGTIMANGEVFINGGGYQHVLGHTPTHVNVPEIWNPDTGQWRVGAEATNPRGYHSTTLLLPDGRIWTAGGECGGDCTLGKTAQVYTPPYLFNLDGSLATRPSINSVDGQISYGETFNANVASGNGISKITFIRLGSSTHHINFEQRYQELSFQQNGNNLTITAPAHGNLAPPGYYMLFVIDNKGVPSEAEMVQILGSGPPPPNNNDPVLTTPSNQVNDPGDSVSLQLSASDPDNDPITFDASGLPTGLSIDQNTGLIDGTLTASGDFVVSISVVDDNGGADTGNFNWTVNGTPPPPGGGTGQITHETWNTSWGTTLDVLRGTASFPNSPDTIQVLTTFEAPLDQGSAFGQRISGYLYPPVSGQYTFWIASDDQGELWLSSNDQAANISLIASVPDWTFSQQWDKHPSQQSQSITLQTGEIYYIEALAQEGSGGDNLAVAWQIPGSTQEIIDGQYLAPADNTPPGNNDPVLTNPGNRTNQVGDTVSLQLSASDTDGDSLTFSATGLPVGLNLNSSSGFISGSPSSAGISSINVSVSDGNGGSDSANFTWTVSDTPPNNIAPILTNPGNQTNQASDTVSLQLSANDSDGDTLTFSASGLPAGLNLNPSSGLIGGSPSSAGTSSVNISVSDGNGGSDSASFTWTVTDTPLPPGGGTGEISWQKWNTGWGTSLAILRNNPNFPDNPTTTSTLTLFEAAINQDDTFGQRISGFIYPPVTGQYSFWISSDDDGELWLSTDDQASNIVEIASVTGWTNSREWTKYPSQQSQAITLQADQAYYIEALAQDGAGGDNLAVAWQIPGGSLEVIDGQYLAPADNSTPPPPPGNNDPVLTNPGSQTDTVGNGVSLQLSATDPDGDTLTFAATGLPAGLNLNQNSGLISGSPTTAGSTNATVSVSDGNGGSHSANFSWTVNTNAPPPPGGGTGEVRLETWNTSWGTTVSVLRATSSFPNNPDTTQTLTSFEAPTNQGDVFGQRISGYLYPPVTGNYTFWIASDDQGELWLSTTSNPADIVLLATVPSWTLPQEWEKFSVQQSVTVTLQAGQAYYIEALAQEGGGGDHLAAAWQVPGQAREVIAGQYLAPADNAPP